MKKSGPQKELLDGYPGNSFGSKSEDDQPARKKSATNEGHPQSSKDINLEGGLVGKAEMYLEYMKHIPIPAYQHSIIPCSSWQGLAKSMKQLYRQPLHYLTNILLRKWDISRIGSDDEYQPLDMIIHPSKAEAIIWGTEEVHRCTTSGQYLADLWASDPLYHAYIDPIFP